MSSIARKTKQPSTNVDTDTECRLNVDTDINAQDLAVCHLLYERALRERPLEVGGDAL